VLRTFITLLTSPLNWNKIRNIKKKESARCFILVNLTANITTNNQAGYGVIGVKQTINAAIYTLSKKKGIVEALAMGSKICSASQHSNLPLEGEVPIAQAQLYLYVQYEQSVECISNENALRISYFTT